MKKFFIYRRNGGTAKSTAGIKAQSKRAGKRIICRFYKNANKRKANADLHSGARPSKEGELRFKVILWLTDG